MWAISMIFLVPVPLNSACTMAPGFARRVVHPVDVGRLDDLDLAAEPGQAFADQRRQPGQPLGVLAAGFDVHEIAQRVEQRGFFLLREVMDARSGAAREGRADKARAQAARQARGRRAGRDMVTLSKDLQMTT